MRSVIRREGCTIPRGNSVFQNGDSIVFRDRCIVDRSDVDSDRGWHIRCHAWVSDEVDERIGTEEVLFRHVLERPVCVDR